MFVKCKSCCSVFVSSGSTKPQDGLVCIRGKCNIVPITDEEASELAEEEIERRRNQSSRADKAYR